MERGAPIHERVHRASRQDVRRLADADRGRRGRVDGRGARRNTIPPNSSKGRLMRFEVMRAGAAALAMSVAFAGAAYAQTKPATPAAPAGPGQAAPGAPAQPA